MHGGKYYSSGQDLSLFASSGANTKEENRELARVGIFDRMNALLTALNQSVKPIVVVVRGGAVGIWFTALSLVDFIYCSPDAFFMTPFMKTFQSPEGSSTLHFKQ